MFLCFTTFSNHPNECGIHALHQPVSLRVMSTSHIPEISSHTKYTVLITQVQEDNKLYVLQTA